MPTWLDLVGGARTPVSLGSPLPSSHPSPPWQVPCLWLAAVFSLLNKCLNHKQQKCNDSQPLESLTPRGLGKKRLPVSGLGVGSTFLGSNHWGRLGPGMQLEGPAPCQKQRGRSLGWLCCGFREPSLVGEGRAAGRSSWAGHSVPPGTTAQALHSLLLIQASGGLALEPQPTEARIAPMKK